MKFSEVDSLMSDSFPKRKLSHLKRAILRWEHKLWQDQRQIDDKTDFPHIGPDYYCTGQLDHGLGPKTDGPQNE